MRKDGYTTGSREQRGVRGRTERAEVRMASVKYMGQYKIVEHRNTFIGRMFR